MMRKYRLVRFFAFLFIFMNFLIFPLQKVVDAASTTIDRYWYLYIKEGSSTVATYKISATCDYELGSPYGFQVKSGTVTNESCTLSSGSSSYSVRCTGAKKGKSDAGYYQCITWTIQWTRPAYSTVSYTQVKQGSNGYGFGTDHAQNYNSGKVPGNTGTKVGASAVTETFNVDMNIVGPNLYGGTVNKNGSSITLTVTKDIPKYTLTYNANGGSVSPSSKSVEVGAQYGMLPTPTKTGNRFGGWYTSSSGGSSVSQYTTMGSSNTTIYAHWTPENYTMTTYHKYGSSTITTTTDQAAYGSTYTPSYTYIPGYSQSTKDGGKTVTGNMTFNAYYTKIPYTVTVYHRSGSTILDTETYTKYYNDYFSPSSKSYTKYSYSSMDGGGYITSDKTFNVYYTLRTYPVTYYGNGNTSGSAPASQSKVYDETLTLRTNTNSLARKGYDFAGWNTSSSGTGTSYSSGGSYSSNASLTLYAKWTVRNDTPYKVEHYQMKSTGSGYTLFETENFTGTTESYVSPGVKTYFGFVSPSVTRQQISGNGDTVIKYYYDREKYKVYYELDSGFVETRPYEDVYYGYDFSKDFALKPGYTFKSMEKHKKE